ncbi:MAG: enoyl-ACP reductase [Anaerolineales bacterium]|nr:enoyl-ACP reductase [Anaerolineales bacterium]
MSILSGKKALIFGLANERSIAWGIANAFHRQGATLGFSYAPVVEKYARPLAEGLGATFLEACDVTQDERIEAVAGKAAAAFGEIDILIHSIAFADKDELNGPYYTTSRRGFHLAMDVSVYSFVALARIFQPLLKPGGALLSLTYYGAEKVIPGYNVMGVAKAALEASTRYLAHDFGPQGIRVNAISAGPIRTLAAAGISNFKDLHGRFAELAPLRQNVTAEDVGNAAVFLCSDMAARITGEVLYVDSGYNIMGVPEKVA